MMPGENPSKVAGIASEAAGSCQNCTSLQQNLNEYVAALITLKQKIIDSDHLFAEYQHKCDDLRDAERENKTLRYQLEQMLQKISPWEQTEEQLKSFRIELEKKTSVLDVVHQSQLEIVGVKKACKKCNMVKKKHQAKLKKTEAVASKHIKCIKQLQQEKRIIERELKKIQKKLGDVQNKSMKNAQTQVAKDQPVVKLDKKKIRILLEELWDCIESSTENSDELETNLGKGKHLQSPDDHTPSLKHFNPSTLSCKFDTFSEVGVVNASKDSTDCKKSHEIHTYKDAYNKYTDDQQFQTETTVKDVFVLQDLNDSHLENSDNECDIEELSQIMCWAKPLPHLLSPLQFSPFTTKYVFGEFTDSSDNEGSAKGSTSLERKQNCVQDQTNFVPCPEEGNVTEDCKQNVEFGRNVKYDRISLVEDCLTSQSEFCSNYKGELTTEMETDKDIEITPMHIEVGFGVASNTLTTNVLKEQNPSEKEHSAVNREKSFEKSLELYNNQNDPVRNVDHIDHSEVELLKHSSSGTIGDMASMLEHPVGGDISGRVVIENLHCSKEDRSISARCNMVVHHNQSLNANGVLFSKDSPVHNCNLDERKSIKSLQVYNEIGAEENHVTNIITSAEENHVHNNLSVHELMDNSSYTIIDRSQDNLLLSAQPEMYLNEFHHNFNDSRDLKDSEQSISCLEDVHNRKPNNGTSMDGEICFAAQTVQPLDELKEKSGHSSSTPVVQFEYIKLINQYYTAKIDKIDPKHIQELPVHKANISLKQKLALRRLADGGHCYKASFNELAYDMQDSLEITPASTPFHLDSSTTDKENHVSETFADKDSTCLSMEKLEDESKGNILASLQTCAIKAKESTHKSDGTSTCHIVTEQCKIGSEKVQLCSSDSNLYTLVSSKEQKAAVVDIQPVIATQLDICSQSQAVADQLCSAKHNPSRSTFLLHNTLSSNLDTTTADGYLNRLEGKPFLTSKDMPQLSDQQFIKVSVNLVTDSRDQLDTVNKDLCKEINPKKDTCAELDSTLEKTNTVYSLQSNSDTLPKTFNQSTIMPIFPLEEEQRFNLCSDSTKVINKIAKETDANQDASSAYLDSSEEENFVIRKVSNAKAVSNNPVNLKKSSKGALESLEETVCNVHLESNNSPCKPIITQRADIECAGDLAACVTSENDYFSSKNQNGILMEHESLVAGDLIVDQENYKSNSKNNGDQYSCEKENETTILEECEKQKEKLVSENIQYDNNTDQKFMDTIENEGKKTFPVKNFIWNFERPEGSVDPGVISGKHKTRGNLKMLHGGSNNSFHRTAFNMEERTKRNRSHKVKYSNIVCQAVTKENHQQKLSRGEQSLQDTHVGETVLANADTSTNSDHSPETITKVRSEMGPPLPPLLGPLLATPPKSIHPLSPFLSSSSCSSLPSPLDDLISPLPGTPFPRQVSPLTNGRRQKSPVLATPSPAEKANRRILSSPLQFCAATPKHALPVPGRFPLSASGSSSNNVQENSVKILDTMYPELSARARTLNILKGNVQLSRSLPRDGKNLSVSQITGFKSITSTSTVFIKTGGNSNVDSSKDKLSSSENQQKSRSIGSSSEQTTDAFLMPRSAKRLRLDTESPVIETIKNCSTTPTHNDTEGQKCQEACHNIGYCELLPDVVKDSSIDEDITKALKKIEDLCFDLLPVIRSHVHVGTIPKVPVMRNEEKEAIYEFSTSKKSLADRFLQVVLNKIRTGKRSIAPTYLQALCRVYVGLCRRLGNIERARILCYSILKEDFPDPDRLLLFIVSSWNDIFSTYGVVSKAIQAVLKNLAKDDVGSCLSAYLNWGKVQPMSVTVLLSSILMAVQLYPDGKFQQSKKYGEDLTDSIWEYVFAVDLLCSHRKWVWTHDKIISKELWPLLDKWVKRKKGNPNVSFVSDILVATVLRLVGHLCQMGLKEGFVTAVKNIGAVITAFLQHANEEGMPWGVQLACVYMLFDLAPSDPAAIYKTLQAWKESAKSDIPPAVASCMQELESMCGLIK